jgi:hemerythrin-like metal-binding protein
MRCVLAHSQSEPLPTEDDMTADMTVVPVLGIGWMDEEHRELARLLDEFAACIKEGDPDERAHAIVTEAVKCGNAHFEHEEVVAAQTNYPKIEDEKFNHRHLRLQFTTLVGDTVDSGYCDPVTLEHLEVMCVLLDEHIKGPDRELADYLRAAGFN